MALDVITIWNLALSAVGATGRVSAVDEVGREADLCRLWYPLVRDVVLKAAPWPGIKAYQRLAVRAERDFSLDWTSSDPSPGWKYAYAAPSDLLAPRYLTSFARFTLEQFDGESCIMTQQPEAVLHYLQRETDPGKWDMGLTNAVLYSLGAVLAMPLTGKRTLMADLRTISQEAIMIARTDAANEEEVQQEMLPSWIVARDYDGPVHLNRFVWPYDDLSGVLT